MRNVLVGLCLFLGTSALAGETQVPVTFQVETVEAACKKTCRPDRSGEGEFCSYKVFFESASFDLIKRLGKEQGLRRTWFKKSPKELCESNELPAFEEGTFDRIDVLLYKVDLSSLSDQL